MTDQLTKARAFQALHARPETFVIPNPWDAGTARLLAGTGFPALATTSNGVANMLGKSRATLEEVLDNCRTIVGATHLPVSADLENGFADAPREAARAIRLAADAGAVGGSIEDATGDPDHPIYDFDLAVERVEAAVEAARSLSTPFVLTARADNLLHGQGGLDEAIRRLQAFEAAGADVLYAPGLTDLESIRTVVSAVGKPLNVVMGLADPSITVAQLSELGVRRISIGGALSRLALGLVLEWSREMHAGGFTFLERFARDSDLEAAFRRGTPEMSKDPEHRID